MDPKPKNKTRLAILQEMGVTMPNPQSVDLGEEVPLDHISGNNVVIFPGCRIHGRDTVISHDVKLGAEAPVTLDNCQLASGVELKGGYFRQSVFLEGANVGSGAQIREACLLEEEANGAHCVGLKQTILFPFVTLGSLINFCDCLMAGGTSRKNHSEVGSSYIHFNFTPDGDKATASLFGDVARGVMLRQPPIFLGGQGGAVGPLRLGFGNVVAAGSILRGDYLDENRLVVVGGRRDTVTEYTPMLYPNLRRLVENNVYYLANLLALREWYTHVRQRFLANQEFGPLIYAGAQKALAQALDERTKRLKVVAGNMPASLEAGGPDPRKSEFGARFGELAELLAGPTAAETAAELRDKFLARLFPNGLDPDQKYVRTIQDLPPDAAALGTGWLEAIVETICRAAADRLPSFALFQNNQQD